MQDEPRKVLVYCAAGGNSGDDYILHVLVAKLRYFNQGVEITIACPNPVSAEYFDCDRSVKTFNQIVTFYFGRRWLLEAVKDIRSTLRMFRESSVVFVGGGGLFNDQFGFSWLAQWLAAPIVAKLFRIRCVAVGVGAGPIVSPFARWATRRCMRLFDAITVRDQYSYDTLGAVMRDDLNLRLAIDPAFFGRAQEGEMETAVRAQTKTQLLFVPRFDAGRDASVKKFIVRLCVYAARRSVGLSLVASSKREFSILENFVSSLGGNLGRGIPIYDGSEHEKIISLIRSAGLLVTMRMHPAIFASNVRSRLITIETYDPKLKSIAELVGCDNLRLDLRDEGDIDAKAKLCVEQVFQDGPAMSARLESVIGRRLAVVESQLSL
jgi:polysaccharide pyruvyl transferase WcaK-like protein